MEDWSNWCRLCGRVEIISMDLNCESANQIKSCFSVELCTDDDIPIIVCSDCMKFTIKFEEFREQVVKVDKMFTHLFTVWKNGLTNKNLSEIRIEYGIDYDSNVYTEEPEDFHNESISILPIDVSEHLEVAINSNTENVESKTNRKRKRVTRKKPYKRVTRADIKETTIKNEKAAEAPLEECEKDNGKNHTVCSKTAEDKFLTFECPVCSTQFKSPQLRSVHLKSEHSDIEKPYKCDECPKAFPESYKLKCHKFIHLPASEKPVHRCSECKKIFHRHEGLMNHIDLVHVGERNFICEQCGKSFHTNYRLKEHYLTHSEKRVLQCSYCEKSFKNRQQLNIHEDTHSGTSYECKICHRILNTKRNLNDHLLVHSDVKRFKCHLCDNAYKRKKALKSHIATNHMCENTV